MMNPLRDGLLLVSGIAANFGLILLFIGSLIRYAIVCYPKKYNLSASMPSRVLAEDALINC